MAQRILDAAVQVFSRKGYAGAATREIAEMAGVTRPMLYYYFESKDGLCRAALEQYIERLNARTRRIVETPMDARQRLVELVAAHFEFLRDEPDFFRLAMVFLFGPVDEAPHIDTDRFSAAIDGPILDAIAVAARSDVVRPGCDQAFLFALRGITVAYAMAVQKGRHVPLDRALAASTVSDLLEGFGLS